MKIVRNFGQNSSIKFKELGVGTLFRSVYSEASIFLKIDESLCDRNTFDLINNRTCCVEANANCLVLDGTLTIKEV